MDFGGVPQRSLGPAGARKAAGVCVIVRAETKPGADEEFERLLSELAQSVRAKEPGCLSYAVTRELGTRGCFAVHARFAGWLSFHRHAQTAHMKAFMPRLMALMAAGVAMELFLEV